LKQLRYKIKICAFVLSKLAKKQPLLAFTLGIHHKVRIPCYFVISSQWQYIYIIRKNTGKKAKTDSPFRCEPEQLLEEVERLRETPTESGCTAPTERETGLKICECTRRSVGRGARRTACSSSFSYSTPLAHAADRRNGKEINDSIQSDMETSAEKFNCFTFDFFFWYKDLFG